MVEIFTKEWRPAGPARAHVLIVHGYAEHCGRYERLAARLTGAGIHVHGFDHPGHGRSGGRRGVIRRFDGLVENLALQVGRVQEVSGDRPVFLLGHSMGGLAAVSYLATGPAGLAGAVISSPFLAVPSEVSAWKLRASGWLGRFLPWLPVEQLNPAGLSRDREAVAVYKADPLVYQGPVRAGTGAALLHGVRDTSAVLGRVSVPLLVVHGTSDRIAPFSGGERLYEEVGSADRTCFWVDGGYHELLNDLNFEATEDAIVAWLEERLTVDR